MAVFCGLCYKSGKLETEKWSREVLYNVIKVNRLHTPLFNSDPYK